MDIEKRFESIKEALYQEGYDTAGSAISSCYDDMMAGLEIIIWDYNDQPNQAIVCDCFLYDLIKSEFHEINDDAELDKLYMQFGEDQAIEVYFEGMVSYMKDRFGEDWQSKIDNREVVLQWKDDSFKLDSISIESIYDAINNVLPIESEIIAQVKLPEMNKPWGNHLPDDYQENVLRYFENEVLSINDTLFGHVKNIPLNDVLQEYFDQWGNPELHYSEYCISRIRAFLSTGKWQCGFVSADYSRYYTSMENVRQCQRRYRYEDSEGELYPAIWFGLSNEAPIDCWSIARPVILNKSWRVINNESIEDDAWKCFWFNGFWSMDWNQLWGHEHPLITWAFSEFCCDEPVEEFEKVKKACPKTLEESDSTDDLLAKLYNLTNKLYKQ